MKFATALALTSVAAGVSAWSDTFGTIDDQSFSVIIKDPWKSGLDHANTAAVSVNTIENSQPFTSHNTFTIYGDQCTQYVGLPARDDLPYQPQIHLGANFCNRKNLDNLWINYANLWLIQSEHLDVTSDSRCLHNHVIKETRCVIQNEP
ncbi:hypothetical protein E3Q22_01000 [Wallemia mellicola]|uniref:Uncharacterized protein n=1 Tax=Wallemia mellicola TaxID=1708541 RepID=A0A4T0NX08_9BASI|nr:hypothetical protein E3Q22_01000 [Wallemia mellicola]TIC01189.1 hypothetical protein E3Q18_00780 [Wallemia mellicola]TIC04725.1 hypothetical protein E3Q17_00265 [Wallemia mellicola]TIC19828.1 hypothetical protein E3Q13_00960 [Wallemia mellicola]TIC69893.1 hypothetical protein E3Q02_00780 [Wallemia mellicola]